MNWLITGGCGFIGTALIRSLLAEGHHRIRVVDNLAVGTREDLAVVANYSELTPPFSEELKFGADGEDVQLIVGDILDEALAHFVARGVDVIVHLAANTGVGPSVEDPRKDCVTNVVGTLNYLQAARSAGAKRFIFASSGAPVGECIPPIHEEVVPHPVSPYGASKLAGEAYCSAFFRTYGLETIALRFGNVYGPGSKHKSSIVARFVRQALSGEDWEIYGTGKQTRDFIFISDLTRAIRLAAIGPDIGGEVFQIATSRETTVLDLADQLHSILVQAGIRQPAVKHAAQRAGDVLRNYSDTSKARARLGWVAQVSLTEGLRLTVEWYLDKALHEAKSHRH